MNRTNDRESRRRNSGENLIRGRRGTRAACVLTLGRSDGPSASCLINRQCGPAVHQNVRTFPRVNRNMQRIIVLLIVAALGWYGYGKYQNALKHQRFIEAEDQSPRSPPATSQKPAHLSGSGFKCDGRTYCSQMTSCAEATYFLKNCPGTKMDGNNDGIPCENQWCK